MQRSGLASNNDSGSPFVSLPKTKAQLLEKLTVLYERLDYFVK